MDEPSPSTWDTRASLPRSGTKPSARGRPGTSSTAILSTGKDTVTRVLSVPTRLATWVDAPTTWPTSTFSLTTTALKGAVRRVRPTSALALSSPDWAATRACSARRRWGRRRARSGSRPARSPSLSIDHSRVATSPRLRSSARSSSAWRSPRSAASIAATMLPASMRASCSPAAKRPPGTSLSETQRSLPATSGVMTTSWEAETVPVARMVAGPVSNAASMTSTGVTLSVGGAVSAAPDNATRPPVSIKPPNKTAGGRMNLRRVRDVEAVLIGSVLPAVRLASTCRRARRGGQFER